MVGTTKIHPKRLWKSLIFRNTEVFRYERFWYCETKRFRRKSWYPLLIHDIFRYQKASETQNGSSMESFGTVWKNSFDEKFPPPPQLFIKLWIPERFWHTKGGFNEIFRYSETKNSTESGDRRSAPLINEKLIFWTAKFYWKFRKYLLRHFLIKVRRRISWMGVGES